MHQLFSALNMCLAIPAKIISLTKKKAVVEADGHKRRVDIRLVKDVKVGDYLLVHDELAVNKLGKAEAKKILKMAGGCHCHCHQS